MRFLCFSISDDHLYIIFVNLTFRSRRVDASDFRVDFGVVASTSRIRYVFILLFDFDNHLYIVIHKFKIPKPSRRRVGFAYIKCVINVYTILNMLIMDFVCDSGASRRRVGFEYVIRGCRVDASDLY